MNIKQTKTKAKIEAPKTAATSDGGSKMDQKQIVKQVMQFNKNAFDSSFSTMTMVYEQNTKMFETFLTQAPGIPAEGQKAIKDMMSAYNTACNDYKKMVDDNYAKVEEYLGNA